MEYITLKDRFRTSVKHYRFKNEYSQEQLGELADVTDKYISDIERGKFTPSLDTIEKISKAFKVDPLELLTDKYYSNYSQNKSKIDDIRGRTRRKR